MNFSKKKDQEHEKKAMQFYFVVFRAEKKGGKRCTIASIMGSDDPHLSKKTVAQLMLDNQNDLIDIEVKVLLQVANMEIATNHLSTFNMVMSMIQDREPEIDGDPLLKDLFTNLKQN